MALPMKTIALASVCAAAIAIPAIATHDASPLRGHWNAVSAPAPSTQYVASQNVYLGSGELGGSYQQAPAYTESYSQGMQTNTVTVGQPYAPQPAPVYAAPHSDVSAAHAYGAGNYAPMYEAPVQVAQAQPKRKWFGLRGRKAPSYAPKPAPALVPEFNVGGVTVRTSAAHSDRMLDWQENTTGKSVTLLQHRKTGVLKDNSLYISGNVQGAWMWQKTDTPGQFPLLSRFPDLSLRTDSEGSVFALNHAALGITSTFGDWTTVYLQPEYTELEFFGQDEFQLRKAFVVFGNFERSPFYAAFGRKTIDFGNFDGYSPFTQSENQHFFWAVSDQPVLELGYYNNGWKLSASAFSGGRQLRTAFAEEPNNIANYAASIEKEFLVGRDGAFTLGASYLHDTIYRNNFTAHSFALIAAGTPPANYIAYENPAYSAFAEYNHPKFDFMVEYTRTDKTWAAAIPQQPDGTPLPAYVDAGGELINDEDPLEVLTVQARWKPIIWGKETAISLAGNWGNISDPDFAGFPAAFPGGPEITFDKNQQHVFGIERQINPYMDLGVEYVYNKGFIPFVAPQQTSNADTEAHNVNIGFKARF